MIDEGAAELLPGICRPFKADCSDLRRALFLIYFLSAYDVNALGWLSADLAPLQVVERAVVGALANVGLYSVGVIVVAVALNPVSCHTVELVGNPSLCAGSGSLLGSKLVALGSIGIYFI